MKFSTCGNLVDVVLNGKESNPNNFVIQSSTFLAVLALILSALVMAPNSNAADQFGTHGGAIMNSQFNRKSIT